MNLSIVITTHNDNAELQCTIQSLSQHTPPGDWELVIVDDCSDTSVGTLGAVFGGIKTRLHRTHQRIGVGAARTVGARLARGEYLLICDSHMRFTPGWYEAAMNRITGRPKTLHCGSCIGLDALHRSISSPNRLYYGATWNMCGPDHGNPKLRQVFEPIWAPDRGGDDYELSAVMGALYFWPREWFLKLNPLWFLKSWGGDEASMSLKCWLAGGEMRMMKSVRVGHLFRTLPNHADSKIQRPVRLNRLPFRVRPEEVLYNKLFTMYTVLPKDIRERFVKKLMRGGSFQIAHREIQSDWRLIETEKAHNESIFERNFLQFCEHFGFSIP